jgi:hypothetical protein
VTRAAIFIIAWALALPSPSVAAPSGHRRFALVVGNDKGGRDTRPLLYAAEDARRFHDLLLALGGVAGSDATLLVNRSAGDLLAALSVLEKRSAEATRRGERTELVVY